MPPQSDTPYPCLLDFELATLRQLLAEPSIVPKLASVVKPKRFTHTLVKLAVEVIFDIYTKTRVSPDSLTVLQEVRNKVTAGKITFETLDELENLLKELKNFQPVESSFILEFFGKEARKSAMWDALETGIRLHRDGNYDKILNNVVKAFGTGNFNLSGGSDVSKMSAQRAADRINGTEPRRIPVGYQELDDVLKGGLAPGELGVIVGAPKRGKSFILSDIAINCAGMGGLVVYFTMELSEREIINRMDAHISGSRIDDLKKNAEAVDKAIQSWHLKSPKGALIVKQFPSASTSVRDLNAFLEQVRIDYDASPTLVIADSGDFMRPDSPAENTYMAQGDIYKELKGLASKWQIPIWTAAWAKRGSLEKENVGMEDVGESFRKAGISDVGITICGTTEESESKITRLYVAWCRFAQGNIALGPYSTGFEYGKFIKMGGQSGQVYDL